MTYFRGQKSYQKRSKRQTRGHEKMIFCLSRYVLLCVYEYSSISKANEWIDIVQKNGFGEEITIRILPLVIPFNTTGALETFLLQAIAEQDEYDREIIEKGEEFVENVDPEQRYLNKRRYVTKAKFDVYFSVRTAVDQFIDRRNILKDVQWENYVLIQNDFSKLAEL